jgi:pimeloyl-ACP methyl ester carboxylesterase
MPRLPCLLSFVLCAAAAFSPSASALTLEEGELNGAKIAIARPARWNRCVLLLAHGLRAENQPLVAHLDPNAFAYQTYLNEGWIVATTSFRRNGVIIADGVADLDALRAYIAEKDGQPLRVIVEGESLGGLIAILIAEGKREHYAGVVAIGPSLHLKEPGSTVGLSLQPKIPLLFLANQSELEGPKNYIASPLMREGTTVRPALFSVARGGHINLNQHERLMALRALNFWIARGSAALPPPTAGQEFFDATVPPKPRPSQVAMHDDGRGFDTHVAEVSSLYGHAVLDAQPADFAAVGIRPFTWFQVTMGEKTFRAFYGRDYHSVKRNEWVALPSADGNFIFARNLGDVIAPATVKAGEIVRLRRYGEK